MAKDSYTDVMEGGVDQAKRYEALVEKHRAFAETPAGKKLVEGCMRWLTYCAEMWANQQESTLDGYHKWLKSQGQVQRTGQKKAAAAT